VIFRIIAKTARFLLPTGHHGRAPHEDQVDKPRRQKYDFLFAFRYFSLQEPTLSPREQGDAITVYGARVHNLKNINVRIPLNSLTVVTGVSGSGKSSLAFETLYAEGQRRYLASLSAYARQFLERLNRPDVDDIDGICPSLAIRQRRYSRNPRSTVGTVTEINDYLRLLYARIGVTHCYSCARIVERDTPEKIADFVMSLPAATRLYLCIPLLLGEKTAQESGPHRQPGSTTGRRPRQTPGRTPEDSLALMIPGLERQGFIRLLVGNQTVPLADAVEALRAQSIKEAHVLVDRLVSGPDVRPRLADSLELCGRESNGIIELVFPSESPQELTSLFESKFPHLRYVRHPVGVLVKFSERFECQLCHIPYETPEPRLFSFNNPFGACPECQGFGNTVTVDLDRVVPDKYKSLTEGAVEPWTKPRYRSFHDRMLHFAEREAIDIDAPWRELPETARESLINGKGNFPGIYGFFACLEEKKYKMHVRIFASRYRGYTTCPTCQGDRLRREATAVLVDGRRISQITHMTIGQASEFFAELRLTPAQETVAGKILEEIRHRLDLESRAGLDYITLDRLSSTLSGGESQRIQLATSLGSTLVGALYVLDEPSIGLHPRDSRRLIEILKSLKALGNTVLVVEHDAEIMKAADHIIDLGPGAGERGGQVVCQGNYQEITAHPLSLTGRYLKRELRIPVPIFRRKGNGRFLELLDVHKHNLKHLNLRIPLGMFVCITGVSGSGKSTLVHDALYQAIKRTRVENRDLPNGVGGIRGAERITDAVLVDQSPIGRTPRSNPVTYIKAFDEVREIFAATRDAYIRNMGTGHFSFNLAGGRCESCQGSGTITVEMQFLADVELTCEDCKGTRYKSSVLDVRYKGMNIAEVLALTVQEAIDVFHGHALLVKKLKVLEEIGLGYLRLGQSATSLSGGEAQRVKLASFLGRKSAQKVLYIFDEPTSGLHFDDIRKLLTAFDKLINTGNSLIVIEHNLDVIKTADWVIDLGPEGGEAGGELIFEGPPEQLLACARSHTARFLKSYIQ
jgi:excinuclease ABC subunit A